MLQYNLNNVLSYLFRTSKAGENHIMQDLLLPKA
jgi:hypothetical protein